MVGIQRIGGTPEFANIKRTVERDKKTGAKGAEAHDAVEISDEARAALDVARLTEETALQEEMRAERVAEAKEAIEKGSYKLQHVILQVAARISAYISL